MTDLVFRAALRLYPPRLRARFGAEMLDYMRETYRRCATPAARVGYWRQFGADLVSALLATWTDRDPRDRESSMVSFLRDVARSGRDLLRQPGFALPAVLTLAIGIGASAAVFTLLNGIVLAPLPYRDPGQLVRVHLENSPTNLFPLSVADYLGLEESHRSFEALAAFTRGNVVLAGGARPTRVRAGIVTATFFDTLGVQPAEGRGFLPGEDREGAAPVVVISASLRDEHFGVGADAVGESIDLDGDFFTVVGVMGPGFRGPIPGAVDLWSPLQLATPPRRGPFFLRGIGRLNPDLATAALDEDLADISRRTSARWADTMRDDTVVLGHEPLHQWVVGGAGNSIAIAFAAVVLVLLVAIANVTNLVLGRTVARGPELSVRTAMGASRGRLARLLLADGLVLAAVSGGIGLLLGGLALAGFRTAGPGLPRMAEVGVDGATVVFVFLVGAVAAATFSAAPMLLTTERTLRAGLKEGGRGAAGSRVTNQFRTALVAGEFALVLPLLVGGALLSTSLLNLNRVDPGYETNNVIAVPVGLPNGGYADRESRELFWREARTTLEGIPGVEAVGLSAGLPPNAPIFQNNFDLVDRPVANGESEPVSAFVGADEGVRDALGLRLLQGRWFDEVLDGEHLDADWPLVVTESWARRYYPGENAVGKELYSGGNRETTSSIIGVVADVKYNGLAGNGEAVYFPSHQFWTSSMSFVLRVNQATPAINTEIRERLAQIDGRLPPPTITTMEQLMSASIASQRLWTQLLTFFSVSAILLTAVGMFGVLGHSVRQRTREIGVRMALGADRPAIVRMVVGRGLVIAAIGTAVGLALSFAASRAIESMLFGVGRNDPLVLGAACVGLLLVAAVAAYLPARRAARTDPVRAITVG